MIDFQGYKVPPDFKSDGCTYAPDSWFGIDLTPACKLHDFQRRFGTVSVQKADKLLKAHIKSLGAPSFLAHWFWLGSKLARKHYKHTEILPSKWAEYN